MVKKGQVTLFVVIAVVVVILIIFLINRNFVSSSKLNVKDINSYFYDCLEKNTLEIIYQIGENGGYYEKTNFSISSGIPIYYSNGKSYMPKKEFVIKEIEKALRVRALSCVEYLKNFSEFNIEYSQSEFNINLLEDRVVVNINSPLTISNNHSSVVLNNFIIVAKIRLGILYNSAEEIMKEQIGKNGVCMSCLLNISLKNDFYASLQDYDENTVIFFLKDKNNKINDKEFVYVFANKYEVKNE